MRLEMAGKWREKGVAVEDDDGVRVGGDVSCGGGSASAWRRDDRSPFAHGRGGVKASVVWRRLWARRARMWRAL